MDPELYKIGNFTSENGRNITFREDIDRQRLEYIVAHPDNYELGSRFLKRQKLDKNAQLTLLQEYLAQTNPLDECTMR